MPTNLWKGGIPGEKSHAFWFWKRYIEIFIVVSPVPARIRNHISPLTKMDAAQGEEASLPKVADRKDPLPAVFHRISCHQYPLYAMDTGKSKGGAPCVSV